MHNYGAPFGRILKAACADDYQLTKQYPEGNQNPSGLFFRYGEAVLKSIAAGDISIMHYEL